MDVYNNLDSTTLNRERGLQNFYGKEGFTKEVREKKD